MSLLSGYTGNKSIDLDQFRKQLQGSTGQPPAATPAATPTAGSGDPGKLILDLKAAYMARHAAGAQQSELDDIHKQADALRSQYGIADSDQVYGNNNGVDPVKQAQMTQELISARNQGQPTGLMAPQQTSSAPQQAAAQPTNTAKSLIDQLAEAKQKAQIAALGKSRDAAISNLGQEKAAIQPKYYDAKNQVAAGAQQQTRNFAEYMAQRGGANSGANAQATLMNNMSSQGNLGALGRQEAQAFTDIGRRESDVQNAYQSDVASTTAGGEADKMNALLSDYYTNQQRELQIAQLMGVLGGEKTLDGQKLDRSIFESDRGFNYQTGRDAVGDNQWQQQFQEGQKQNNLGNYWKGLDTFGYSNGPVSSGQALTDMYKGAPTLQSKQIDRSNFESDRQYNLAKSGQEWSQMMQKQEFDFNKAQQLWDNNFKDKSFQQSMNEAAESRGLQWATLNQRDKEFIADQAYKEKSFQADLEQRGIDNKLKDAQTQKLLKDLDTPAAIDDKTSTDNYNSSIQQFQAKKGLTKQEALSYVQANKSHFSDSDYQKLSDWINKNIVK